MKNRKSILLLLCIIFISCGHPAESAASGIQQSLEKLKEKLETLSAKLKSLSGSLGTLRYNLDTEEQAAQVITELANKDLSAVIDEAESKSEKVAVAKRLFYADKNGETAIKKVVEEKGGEGLDKIYGLLKEMPKNQRVALMDNVVKNLNLSKMSPDKQEQFLIQVVIKNGLSKSFDVMKGKFGSEKLREWFIERKKDLEAGQGDASSGRLTPLFFIAVDNPELMSSIIELYSEGEFAHYLGATIQSTRYNLVETFFMEGHIKILSSLRSKHGDKIKNVVDDGIKKILRKKKQELLWNFLRRSEDPILAVLFLLDHYRDAISLPAAFVLYRFIHKEKNVNSKVSLLVKTLINEKKQNISAEDKKGVIESINFHKGEGLKLWISQFVELLGGDFNFQDKDFNNPLHLLIFYISEKTNIPSEDLEYALDVFSKNVNLEGMKNQKNGKDLTPFEYLEPLGSKVNHEIKSKIIDKLFSEKQTL